MRALHKVIWFTVVFVVPLSFLLLGLSLSKPKPTLLGSEVLIVSNRLGLKGCTGKLLLLESDSIGYRVELNKLSVSRINCSGVHLPFGSYITVSIDEVKAVFKH